MNPEKNTAAIEIVEKLNATYQNQSKPVLKKSVQVGPSIVHTYSFKGERGRWYENYVVERNGKLHGFQDSNDVIQDVSSAFSWYSISTENIKHISLVVLTTIMVLALVAAIFLERVGAEVLVGLIGAGLGYIAGKADSLKS